MEIKQMMAVFEALSFLGTAALLTAGGVVMGAAWVIGESRLSRGATVTTNWIFGGRGLIVKTAIGIAALACSYFAALLGASVASREWTLGPGKEKYFCEVDCHLAYSVAGVATTRTLGSGALQTTANGMFYVVNVRTRFDETTISRHRGNFPLEPAPRIVTLVDDQGREYPVSAAGEQALAQSLGAGTPMMQPLRPGESYTTQLVFDLPPGARNPRLLISSPTNPTWLGRLLIGDENSLFHKKVLFHLPTGSSAILEHSVPTAYS